MTEDELRALYPGQIRTEPHKYTGPEAHYLVYLPRDHADLRGEFVRLTKWIEATSRHYAHPANAAIKFDYLGLRKT